MATMELQQLEARMDAMDKKLDLLLEFVQQQKLQTETVSDLVSDLTIVGKDIYNTAVTELDNRQVELDPAEVTELLISFLRNVKHFSTFMATMESTMDLLKDLSPIVNELAIDAIRTADKLDKKGYFDFARESVKIVDNVVTGFKPEDVRALADNIVMILGTLKELTQPNMMRSIHNAVRIFSSLETDNVPEVSVWKLIRIMNKPEMKKGIGFMTTFLENLSKKIEN